YSFKGAFKALASVVGAADSLCSSNILPQSQNSDSPTCRRTQTRSQLAVNDPARLDCRALQLQPGPKEQRLGDIYEAFNAFCWFILK
ncbi:hypothetical protein ATANTOWER_004937, partial [Ataeniobius toweri]|nr:hypothetical protein [Ataeniobius toweri]